jgi:predicted  nucleic acid-binding Zn-ribbon protein
MGSMASGIEDLHDSSGPAFGQLETLDEVEGSISPQPEGRQEPDRDLLHTPKPAKAALAAPTDTVIARHVRDVQVPESLAKEYKNRGGLLTPARPSTSDTGGFGTSTASRHGRSLTLKEQSSTIERLSKENFDLKLKVMFLSDRLDKLSEEGIKEMISENVELKTGLAVLQRDNKVLRRRVKELEKQLKDEEERPGTARSGHSDDEQSAAYDQEAQEREEELIYLREQIEEYVTEIERLRNENLNREAEKRRMAEVMRTLGEKTGERLGENFERQEEADVWKDLLEQETARREQSDEDNRRLRDEIFRLKQELAAQSTVGPMHHTTNIYNITKKSRERPLSPTRPGASFSGDPDGNGTMSVSSTLVEELRRESEQLRHENAELRREVGAQTSMLTSRNREKERLYQEIEDLKMAQRRGAPAPSTIDSLLERSASRAGVHERSQSRASGITRVTGTAVDEADLEELENKMAELRDKNNDLKLQNQDLQRELNGCMEDFEAAVEAKKQAEELVAALQEDLETTMNDLMALQAERDEALQEHANLENEFEALRKEAQEEIDALEGEADQRTAEIERLQLDLNDRTENFDALQAEMRKMSEALVRLEDEQAAKLRRIQELEQELGDANKELEDLEAKLLEANDKANRLSVQQESSQGEIAFLREEQETDKIRIGDLEAALANAEQSLREEKERARELEQRLATERRQREMVANREKEEVQQFVNELNKEASAAKDEARRLRKSLTSREVEATEWKERLIELENNLREALGDLNGTRSSLLKVSFVDSDKGANANLVSPSQNSNATSKTRSATSTPPSRHSSRKTASSSSAMPCLSRTPLSCASWARCWIRNGRPIATSSTSSRPSRRHTSTSPGPSAPKTSASWSLSKPSRRTRSASRSSRTHSRSSSRSVTTCSSFCGPGCLPCAALTGRTTTASSMGGRCRVSRPWRPCFPVSARTCSPPLRPSRPWLAASRARSSPSRRISGGSTRHSRTTSTSALRNSTVSRPSSGTASPRDSSTRTRTPSLRRKPALQGLKTPTASSRWRTIPSVLRPRPGGQRMPRRNITGSRRQTAALRLWSQRGPRRKTGAPVRARSPNPAAEAVSGP